MGNAVGTPPSGPRNLLRGGAASAASNDGKRYFTAQQLKEFDGSHGKIIYIGLLGEIYDVSSDAKEYGPNGKLHVLAGKEASRAVATAQLTEEEACNLELSDLTDAQMEELNKWVTKFRDEKKYLIVGRLLIPQDLTREALKQYNGEDNRRSTVLVAISGVIYDVTMNGSMHYGPGGTYAQFAGRDASKALACMSFDEDHIENPTLDDLTPEQQTALADWETRFQQKYVKVGKLL